MKTTPMSQHHRPGRSGPGAAGVLGACMLVVLSSSGLLRGEPLYYPDNGNKVVLESGAASMISEKVRTAAPGTLVALFVKNGDSVQRGQLLGHTELDNAKYQMDMARSAVEKVAEIEALKGHAEAWAATLAETQEAVRKRKADKARLDWAIGMEKFHRWNYEAKLEQKKIERFQFDHWKRQYENRFLRAPVDGVVTEVLTEIGRQLGHAAHVLTINNDESYVVPVSVPTALAGNITKSSQLPVRSISGGHIARGSVNDISDDPSSPGRKLIRLLLNRQDFPPQLASNLVGMKFDVLLPLHGEDTNI
jgi:multidrug efflux pump subunit AcrA (membrane-fusion protein)